MSEHKEPRIGPLDTVGGITTEMGRVYRNMRRKELDTLDGSKLIAALAQMRTTFSDDEFEGRPALPHGRRRAYVAA